MIPIICPVVRSLHTHLLAPLSGSFLALSDGPIISSPNSALDVMVICEGFVFALIGRYLLRGLWD